MGGWLLTFSKNTMRCVTDDEVSIWLGERAIPEAPYSGQHAPKFYCQFYPPSEHSHIDAFIRIYYARIISAQESLVHITDWALYQDSEMMAIAGIRVLNDESRCLIDASGHRLSAEESEKGVSLLGLTTAFGWTSYLYSSLNNSILYNWEGDIFDFWTDSKLSLIHI